MSLLIQPDSISSKLFVASGEKESTIRTRRQRGFGQKTLGLRLLGRRPLPRGSRAIQSFRCVGVGGPDGNRRVGSEEGARAERDPISLPIWVNGAGSRSPAPTGGSASRLSPLGEVRIEILTCQESGKPTAAVLVADRPQPNDLRDPLEVRAGRCAVPNRFL